MCHWVAMLYAACDCEAELSTTEHKKLINRRRVCKTICANGNGHNPCSNPKDNFNAPQVLEETQLFCYYCSVEKYAERWIYEQGYHRRSYADPRECSKWNSMTGGQRAQVWEKARKEGRRRAGLGHFGSGR